MMKQRLCWIVSMALIALTVGGILYIIMSRTSPSRDVDSLIEYIDESGDKLIELAAEYPNRYANIDIYGIVAVDTRGDDIRYVFEWSYDIPYDGCYLYYAADGILQNGEYEFDGDTYIDGLGMNGDGYIKCVKLRDNWFYSEYSIPT